MNDQALIGRESCGCITMACMLDADDESLLMTIHEARRTGMRLEIVSLPVQLQGNCEHQALRTGIEELRDAVDGAFDGVDVNAYMRALRDDDAPDYIMPDGTRIG